MDLEDFISETVLKALQCTAMSSISAKEPIASDNLSVEEFASKDHTKANKACDALQCAVGTL